MSKFEGFEKDMLLATQVALLGEVGSNTRCILIKNENKNIILHFIFTFPPSDDDLESISIIETEIDAALFTLNDLGGVSSIYEVSTDRIDWAKYTDFIPVFVKKEDN